MLVAYFDESGLDNSAFCMGGYIANQETWLQIEYRWKSALLREGVQTFHATDFEAERKQFKNWTSRQRQSLMEELLTIVETSDVYGIGTGVVRSDYDACFASSRLANRRPHSKKQWRKPYYLCFEHCISQTLDHVDGPSPVAFVFDRTDEFQGFGGLLFEALRSHEKWGKGHRLGSLSFASKQEYVGLQLADLLVFELRKLLTAKVRSSQEPMRTVFTRLKVRQWKTPYFDRASLEKLRDLLESDLKLV